MALHCLAKTKHGAPCRAYSITASPYCFWHAPHTQEKRIRASRKGGKATLEDMEFNAARRELWWSIQDTYAYLRGE